MAQRGLRKPQGVYGPHAALVTEVQFQKVQFKSSKFNLESEIEPRVQSSISDEKFNLGEVQFPKSSI